MSIFVHMISYRDPELVPSIRDCIANAARPDELILESSGSIRKMTGAWNRSSTILNFAS